MAERVESNLRKAFKQMLLEYDFEQCQKIMREMSWSWVLCPNKPPSVKNMQEKCSQLFDSALADYLKKGEYTRWYCGGFSVVIFENGDMRIEFIPVILEYLADSGEIV